MSPFRCTDVPNAYWETGEHLRDERMNSRDSERVLVADDRALVLSTMAVLLRVSFDAVDTVSDGRAALEATFNFKPDLVVLDISMPVMSGIEVADELTRQGNEANTVFLMVQAAVFRIPVSALFPAL